MLSGGTVEQFRPLTADMAAVRSPPRRVSRVAKTGRSGDLLLISVEHEIHQVGSLSIRERHPLRQLDQRIDELAVTV